MAAASSWPAMPLNPEDDDDFEERVDFTFNEMDTNKSGAINYMQLRKWISAQMKKDDEVEATGITEEMQKASTDAFGEFKRDDDLLGREQIAALLKSLDLLKYVPEEVRLMTHLLGRVCQRPGAR